MCIYIYIYRMSSPACVMQLLGLLQDLVFVHFGSLPGALKSLDSLDKKDIQVTAGEGGWLCGFFW